VPSRQQYRARAVSRNCAPRCAALLCELSCSQYFVDVECLHIYTLACVPDSCRLLRRREHQSCPKLSRFVHCTCCGTAYHSVLKGARHRRIRAFPFLESKSCCRWSRWVLCMIQGCSSTFFLAGPSRPASARWDGSFSPGIRGQGPGFAGTSAVLPSNRCFLPGYARQLACRWTGFPGASSAGDRYLTPSGCFLPGFPPG
jgi:hypothetical protein